MRRRPTDPMSALPEEVAAPASSFADESLLKARLVGPPARPGLMGSLDHFEVLRLIGSGGMGVVLLARNPVTNTPVAIKVLRPELASDSHAVHRFLTEARHTYNLSHPHILRVLEVSDRAQGPYYVMPYMERGSLAAALKPGEAADPRLILRVAQQVAAALDFAHRRGIIHRDLKPSNILLDGEGNAYLADFGLVRTVFNDSIVDPVRSQCEGTAPYMSPAVAAGEAEDTRCDIYSFGAMLYELLTGQPPYEGRDTQAILKQVLAGPPVPILQRNPTAPPGLVKIAEGAMARELRDRYAKMADMVADLERVSRGQAPIGPHGRASAFVLTARPWRVAAAVALLVALAATGGIWAFHFHHKAASAGAVPIAAHPTSDFAIFDGGLAPNKVVAGEIARLAGHTDGITNLALSPDGRYVVSSSVDKTVRMWDLSSGRTIRKFIGHQDSALRVAWSPDGKYIASSGRESTIRLWDAATGGEIRQFVGHMGAIPALAFLPDGRLVSGGVDHTARLWDTASGAQLRLFDRHSGNVWCVGTWPPSVTGPARSTFFSGSDDGTVRWWDADSGQERARWDVYAGPEALRPLPDGKHWLYGGKDNWLRFGDEAGPSKDQANTRLWAFMPGPTCVAVSPDGKLAAAGTSDGAINVWDITSRQPVYEFRGPQAWVNAVAFDAGGRYVLSGSAEGMIHIWRLPSPLTSAGADPRAPRPESPRPNEDLDASHYRPGGKIYLSFTWSAVPQADLYEVVAAANDYRGRIFHLPSENKSQLEWEIPDFDPTQRSMWRWHVRARVKDVWSDWSDWSNFSMEPISAAQNVAAIVAGLNHGIDHYTQEISRRPDPNSYCQRGINYGALKRDREAVADLLKAAELDPSEQGYLFFAAPFQARLGDQEGYKKTIASLLERFGSSQFPVIQERTAKAWMLAPHNQAELKRPLELIRSATTPTSLASIQPELVPWFYLTRGMAEYRAGNFDVAVDWLNRATAGMPTGMPASRMMLPAAALAITDLYRAMALRQSGRNEGATRAFDRAQRVMDGEPPQVRTGDVLSWVCAELAQREAQELFAGAPDSQPAPRENSTGG